MCEKPKFYITTAIAYTSRKPHIGNAYDIVLADMIARYKKMMGFDVYLMTGSDEHGQKIEDLAKEVGADYIVDEKAKTSTLTKTGIQKAERFFNVDNLSDPEHLALSHHINIAIKAHGIMTRDIDYVVKDGQVLIVDEFTGRIMIGRRYSDGLHQAIEAKENVKIARENKTLATITFQNYFRLYEKLSGMTGTAMTEVEEFREIYSLDAVEKSKDIFLVSSQHSH